VLSLASDSIGLSGADKGSSDEVVDRWRRGIKLYLGSKYYQERQKKAGGIDTVTCQRKYKYLLMGDVAISVVTWKD
jgi:hypothetical protein